MKTDDFDYELPKELIAQTPLKNRSESKLLVMDRVTGALEHKHFYDIIDYLNKGDALVINDTKVIPARIIGVKEETGAVIELLLLKDEVGDTWECLAKPQKRLKVGTIITFGNGELKAKVREKEGETLHFKVNGSRNQIEEFNGKIIKLYPSIFIVRLTGDKNTIKSFSYSDLITESVEIIS